jgi:5-methylcytosine-specific restriction endonuclease McrA
MKIKGVRVVAFAQIENSRWKGKGPGFWMDVEDSREWVECLNPEECAKDWGLPCRPRPKDCLDKYGHEDWRAHQAAVQSWRELVTGDERYAVAVKEFAVKQRVEPCQRYENKWAWIYANKVHSLEGPASGGVNNEQAVLLIKHHVAQENLIYQRISRELTAFENLTRLKDYSREPIPESVRLFVWQRDQGRCVKCEGRELLEFDHVIPIAEGGSSTERNLQLLCQRCNRSKGKNVA